MYCDWQVDRCQEKCDESLAIADAYRIAFEEQLSRNRSLANQLVNMYSARNGHSSTKKRELCVHSLNWVPALCVSTQPCIPQWSLNWVPALCVSTQLCIPQWSLNWVPALCVSTEPCIPQWSLNWVPALCVSTQSFTFSLPYTSRIHTVISTSVTINHSFSFSL